MPNWCYNGLSISGPTEDIQAFDEQFKRTHSEMSGGTTSFPSPVSGESLYGVISKAVEYKVEVDPKSFAAQVHYIDSIKEVTGYSFNNFVPMTIESYISGWYDWSIENWGTKWDISDAYSEIHDNKDGTSTANYNFDTAWGPSEAVVAVMAKQYPSLVIEHTFEEPGVGLAGEVRYEYGMEDSRDEAGNGEDDYLKFKRDVFGSEDINQCPKCNSLYEEGNEDQDEDGDLLCPNCEEKLPAA